MPPLLVELTPQRIAIEREEEWLRVQQTIRDTTRVLVNRQMEGVEDANGRLRKEVETRVKEKVDEMFKMAIPNLRVNGFDYEHYLSTTEPFDQALDGRMKAIYRERVGKQVNIAEQRRLLPNQIRDMEQWIQCARSHLEWEAPTDEEMAQRMQEPVAEQGEDAPRCAETVETFKRSMQNMDTLVKAAPAGVSRADRAQAVKQHITNLPA